MSAFTNSQIESMCCPRRHHYAYNLRLRRDVVTRPMRTGTVFHIGLDARSKHMLACKDLKSADEVGRNAILDAMRENTVASDREFESERMLDQLVLLAMWEGYCARWHDYDSKCAFGQSEYTFSVPIGSDGDTYDGKIDDIRKLPDVRIAIFEHKTTTRDIDPLGKYWTMLPINNQIERYFYALRRNGINVETVVYDAIRVPTFKPKQLTQEQTKHLIETGEYSYRDDVYDNALAIDYHGGASVGVDGIDAEVIQLKRGIAIVETWQMFYRRVLFEILEDADRYFQRREIPIPAFSLKRVEADLMAEIGNIKWHQERGEWPKRTNQCNALGACAYCKICAGMYDVEGGDIPEGYMLASTQHQELEAEDDDV